MNKGWLERYAIPLIRATDPIKEPYTIQELALLLKKPDVKQCSFATYRNWVIVNFLLATGCRAATLLAVRIEDVNLEACTVFFRHMKARNQQVVPLSQTLTEILREYLEYRDGAPEDALFVSEYGNPLCLNTLESAIREYNQARGVDKTSLHLFRHTYAKLYIKAGGDPFRLQKLLGHSDLTMTRRYVALYAEDLKANYDNLNPLEQMAASTRRGGKKKMQRSERD
jgi:integrase/recombinase XerD